MCSRLAIVATLVLGFTFSTTGAGLAITGFTSDDQASLAQYPYMDTSGGTVLLGGGVKGKMDDKSGAHAANEGAGPPAGVQHSRQLEATNVGSGFPFTDVLAIPILLAGLISTGLIMRRNPQRRG